MQTGEHANRSAILGYLEAFVLKTIELHGGQVSGSAIVKAVAILDVVNRDRSDTQIYTVIRKLVAQQPAPYIMHVATRASQSHGPPTKFYKLTPAGTAALAATTSHHEKLYRFLSS